MIVIEVQEGFYLYFYLFLCYFFEFIYMIHNKIKDIQFLCLLYHTFTQILVLTILILI